MNRLPQKTSLVTQTVAIIAEAIEAGRWTSWLPGEHELCEQLHVSRTTLRAALDHLRHLGVIKCQQGRRREIVLRAFSRRKSTSNRVVLLMPDPFQGMLFRAFLIDRLREHLAGADFVLETHVSRLPFRSRSMEEMEKLAAMLRPAGWVLMGASEPLQKWFSDRRLPCVIAGSRYESVDLPSVEVDYRAVCYHAVGRFLAKGHRRIVLLNPQSGTAGEKVTEAGFRKAASDAKVEGVEASVMNHNEMVGNVCARIDSLMARRPPPTAFLISRARHFLTVFCHLRQRGFRVPGDVALISRDHELFLEDVVPTVARYSNNPNLFATKLSRTVIEMVQGNTRVADHKIMSEFIPGETLG